MRVSYDWLKTMIDIPEDPKTLSDEYIRTVTEDYDAETVAGRVCKQDPWC